jgi:predicted alpha/beta-hydrolase family hydrolase
VKSGISLFLLTVLISLPLYAEELVEVESPRGVTQKFLLIQPDSPKAAVILFAGGKGALNLSKGAFGGVSISWGKRNFLVRTREDLAKHGLIVATVDAPSDRQGKKGMLGGFRSSSAHVQDIDSVIAKLREVADVPIWLVGTSRGTESATSIAIASQQQPHGLVLTSSMTVGDGKGQAVTDFNLSAIRIPTLITHHENDSCRKTQPGDVDDIKNGLANAPVVEVKIFSGGRQRSKPCQAMSYHGYLGIEDEVVDAIAGFVLANS